MTENLKPCPKFGSEPECSHCPPTSPDPRRPGLPKGWQDWPGGLAFPWCEVTSKAIDKILKKNYATYLVELKAKQDKERGQLNESIRDGSFNVPIGTGSERFK